MARVPRTEQGRNLRYNYNTLLHIPQAHILLLVR